MPPPPLLRLFPAAVLPLLLLLLLSLLSPSLLVSAKKVDPGSVKFNNRTIDRLVELRTHSIYPPYIDQDLQNRWWDFGADAYINTNKHVRLTQTRQSQTGWLWTRLPLTANNYEIIVEFKISGDSSHLYGDGMAMWLTKERATVGPIYGQVDQFTGLGIVIDTYANERHGYSFPRIIATLGDGNTRYDLGNDGEGTHLSACSMQVRRTNVVTKLKLTYIRDSWLDLKVQYKAWDDWSPCFTLYNVTIPTAPYLGFTALTGDVHDAHDIISVTTSSAFLSAPGRSKDQLVAEKTWGGASTSSSSNSSWLWWFIKWIFIGTVLFIAYTVWQVYVGRQGQLGRGGGGGVGIKGIGRKFGLDVGGRNKRF